jgi:hypothetical protein
VVLCFSCPSEGDIVTDHPLDPLSGGLHASFGRGVIQLQEGAMCYPIMTSTRTWPVGWNKPRHAGVTCNAEQSLPWALLSVGGAAIGSQACQIWAASLSCTSHTLPPWSITRLICSQVRLELVHLAMSFTISSQNITLNISTDSNCVCQWTVFPLFQNLFWFTKVMGTGTDWWTGFTSVRLDLTVLIIALGT